MSSGTRSPAGLLAPSGERLGALYRLEGTEGEAAARARHICNEQTVEYPDDLVGDPAIREQIYGRVVSLRPAGPGVHLAEVSYAVETAGGELPQLLNLLFGNISLVPGVRLERISLPGAVTSRFRGPRFGRAGLRELLRAPNGPLLATALKPMGSSPAALAAQARALALGGLDIVKDDHGLADQPFCPFEERVRRCVDAVAEARARTGSNCLYAPNVTTRAEGLSSRARWAVEAGAGAIVVSGGLVGLDAVRMLAEDDDLGVPVLLHPALLGAFAACSGSGISPAVLHGQLARLTGADVVIFPHHGGRFTVTEAECRAVASALGEPMGTLAPSLPAPAGGMLFERVPEICDFYGGELVLLIGGDLRRHGRDLEEGSRQLRDLVERWRVERA